jgi:hypothetical protein
MLPPGLIERIRGVSSIWRGNATRFDKAKFFLNASTTKEHEVTPKAFVLSVSFVILVPFVVD